MPQEQRRLLILDCALLAWREERHQNDALADRLRPTREPRYALFTFNDIPTALAETERNLILKISGGVN